MASPPKLVKLSIVKKESLQISIARDGNIVNLAINCESKKVKINGGAQEHDFNIVFTPHSKDSPLVMKLHDWGMGQSEICRIISEVLRQIAFSVC